MVRELYEATHEKASQVIVVLEVGGNFLCSGNKCEILISPDIIRDYWWGKRNEKDALLVMNFPTGVPEANDPTKLSNGPTKFLIDIREDGFCLLQDTGHTISAETVKRHWPAFKALSEWGTRINGALLLYVPQEEITQELAEQAVTRGRRVLQYVPSSMKTQEMCEQAVKHDWENILYVPRDFVTVKLARNAVLQDTKVLSSIHGKLRQDVLDEETCQTLVSKDWNNIRLVPFNIMNRDIAASAVFQDRKALDHVPLEILKEVVEIVGKYQRQTNQSAFDMVAHHAQMNKLAYAMNVAEQEREEHSELGM